MLKLARFLLAIAFASGCSVGTYLYLANQIQSVP